MTAKEKIEEAEYNLKKLQNIFSQKEFHFELSNFLSSAQSVFYHLLEQHNQKFGLNLKRNYKIGDFKNEVKRRGNKKEIEFINWYQNELNKIKQNSDYGFLVEKRHLNIHKLSVKADTADTTTSTSYVSSSFGKPFKANSSGMGALYGFNENLDVDIVSICEMFLNRLRKMVDDAERKTKSP